MGPPARWCTSALLVVVLVLLAVPAGLHFGSVILAGLQPSTQAGEPLVPAVQQPPQELSAMPAVQPLSPEAPVPDPQELTAMLDGRLSAPGGNDFTGTVIDALTGDIIYDDDGGQPRVPASNLKLLTAVAALDAFGAGHRFSTSVVQGERPGTVVLVAGGDVLLGRGESDPEAVLGRAGLATLAARTMEALKAAGTAGPVTVGVDDSLFGGEAVNSGWLAGDLEAGQVAPVYPLALNSARFTPEDRYGARPQDAALHAAQGFADALRSAGEETGIAVTAEVSRTEAVAGAAELAAVRSATVGQQVKLMMESSNNYLAEALGRMTAAGGGTAATFAQASRTVTAAIAELGVDTTGMVLVDSSGLSPDNRVSTEQLAQLLALITTTDNQDIRAVLDALPVAGLTGTLDDRFTSGEALEGAGVVRAKTGTLNQVLALSGHVVTAEGRLLTFSFIGNGVAAFDAPTELTLDEAAALLARCGCRQ